MTQKTPNLNDAYAIATPQDNQRVYSAWAKSYDQEFIAEMDYRLPEEVARVFKAAGGAGPVLDIGAGTGALGGLLADVGPVDGTDISQEMLDVAATKQVYRDVFWGDLTDRLPCEDSTYNAVVSSGTFTTGHVGPDAIDEVLRVVKKGGLVVISVNAHHWESAGFKAKFHALGERVDEPRIETVRIYGPRSQGAHKADLGLIVEFRKRS